MNLWSPQRLIYTLKTAFAQSKSKTENTNDGEQFATEDQQQAGDLVSPQWSVLLLSASPQSRARGDLGTTLRAGLFKVIQHGSQNM